MQDDFVSTRQRQSQLRETLMTEDDLGCHLNLARLVSMAHGKSELDTETWQYVKRLEVGRKGANALRR